MRHVLLASLLALLTACHMDFMSTGAELRIPPNQATQNSEQDEHQADDGQNINPWVETSADATSTFSADVDSASYSLARRAITQGLIPDPANVRVEEFVNYFHYDDPQPTDDLPFSVNLEAAPSRFGDADDIHLLRIGIQAEQVAPADRDPVNLVFLLDVSGSMNSPDKLDLVKYSMKHLVDRLSPEDTLGIVVYAGNDGVVLEPTAVQDKSTIMDALDALQAGGSTNGEAGIRTAYDLAESAFRQDGVNRVVLCTDGDMNVGLQGLELVRLVEDFRDRGIFLTTLGFGQGNYNDDLMEQLADNGNGNY
ncbi:MAG TPA: VWA domain-containing protein, partial [Deltaproteobacteria bacterium]|nr:VWA domain-containing protein [Deltaproteobacteria bacterium]